MQVFENLKQKVETLEAASATAEGLNDIIKEVADLQHTSQKHASELQHLEEGKVACKELESALDSLQDLTSRLDILHRAQEALSSKADDLALKSELVAVHEECTAVSHQLSQLERSCAAAGNVEALEQTVMHLEQRCKSADAQIQRLDQEKALNGDVEAAAETLQTLTVDVANLQGAYEDLANKQTNLATVDSAAVLSQKLDDINAAKATVQELNALKESLEDKIKHCHEETEHAAQQQESLASSQQLDSLEANFRSLSDGLHRLQDVAVEKSELAKIVEEVESIVASLTTVQATCETLRESQGTLEATQAHSKDLEDVRQQLHELVQTCSKLGASKADAAGLDHAIKELQSVSKQLALLQHAHDSLKQAQSHLANEDELDAIRSECKQALQQATEHLEQDKASMADLQNILTTLSNLEESCAQSTREHQEGGSRQAQVIADQLQEVNDLLKNLQASTASKEEVALLNEKTRTLSHHVDVLETTNADLKGNMDRGLTQADSFQYMQQQLNDLQVKTDAMQAATASKEHVSRLKGFSAFKLLTCFLAAGADATNIKMVAMLAFHIRKTRPEKAPTRATYAICISCNSKVPLGTGREDSGYPCIQGRQC
jgi:DNA repair exonuclease SbcCD ATPase subunit